MTLGEVLRLYLRHLEGRRSAATVRHYRCRLRTLGDRFGDRRPGDLTPLDIEDWADRAGRFEDGELKAPDTRRANAVAFEQFQAWCVRRRVLTEPITADLEKPRGRLRERLPTAEETAAILEAASEAFRLVYRALRQSGARPSELCGLRIEEIDVASGEIVIEKHKTAAKTGRSRRIAIGEKLAELLRTASGERTNGPVFVTPREKAWTVGNLSKTFRRLRSKLMLDRSLVLYLTRHEHASQLCAAAGIHAAAEALGHASIQTTRRYVKTDRKTLQTNQDLVE